MITAVSSFLSRRCHGISDGWHSAAFWHGSFSMRTDRGHPSFCIDKHCLGVSWSENSQRYSKRTHNIFRSTRRDESSKRWWWWCSLAFVVALVPPRPSDGLFIDNEFDRYDRCTEVGRTMMYGRAFCFFAQFHSTERERRIIIIVIRSALFYWVRYTVPRRSRIAFCSRAICRVSFF